MAALDDLFEAIQDARRYRWLRKQFSEGLQSHIGEWSYSEDELDKYIDEESKEVKIIVR